MKRKRESATLFASKVSVENNIQISVPVQNRLFYVVSEVAQTGLHDPERLLILSEINGNFVANLQSIHSTYIWQTNKSREQVRM